MEEQRNQETPRGSIQDTANQDGIQLIVQEAEDNQQTANHGNKKEFPIKSFRILGGLQILFAVPLVILNIIGVGLEASVVNCHQNMNESAIDYYYRCKTWTLDALFLVDFVCLFCSGWYMLTGLLPFCMSERRQNSLRNLKRAFLVCSIIGSTTAGLTMLFFSAFGIANRLVVQDKALPLSALTTLLSVCEEIVAVVSASYCCCFTKWEYQQMIVIPTNWPENTPQTPTSITNYQDRLTNGSHARYPRTQSYLTTNQQSVLSNVNHQQQFPANFTYHQHVDLDDEQII